MIKGNKAHGTHTFYGIHGIFNNSKVTRIRHLIAAKEILVAPQTLTDYLTKCAEAGKMKREGRYAVMQTSSCNIFSRSPKHLLVLTRTIDLIFLKF